MNKELGTSVVPRRVSWVVLKFALVFLFGLLMCYGSVQPGRAQDLRYELGARLRMFERDFELSTTPEARELPLEKLNNSVQHFFGLKMLDALQDLDAARLAIQPLAHRSTLEKLINMRVNINARLLDSGTQNLECTIDPLYGEPAWSGYTIMWQVDRLHPFANHKSSEDKGPLATGSLPLTDSSDVKFFVPLQTLPDGDYLLRLSAQATSSLDRDSSSSENPSAIIAERLFSVARNSGERVKNLVIQLDQLGETLDATQVASLKCNVKTLKRVLDGASLETDYPATRILQHSELAMQKLLNGQLAYGNREAGEFWLVAATSSGQKWLRLRAPEAVTTGKPLPLVIALHGAGGSENMFFDTYGHGKIVTLTEQRQWLLVAPRVAMGGLKLDELVQEIDSLYPVDRQSIFIVGHSMGAGAAVTMTASANHKPIAVAALGGGRAVPDPAKFQGVSFWIAAGSHDFGRGGAKQLSDSLLRGSITTEYREYENVEHLAIVQVALNDVFEFFDLAKSEKVGGSDDPQSNNLRINQLQLVGTHNSYHLAPDAFAMKTIAAVVPREAESIDNSQRPLHEQFEQLGVRHVELDVYRDPEGKLFDKPFAYVQAQKQNLDVPVFDPEQRMSQPGIKVLHSPDFDYRTTVLTFTGALQQIKAWSDANRNHVPIFILTELKSDSFSPMTRPLKWTTESFQELESEILSVFPRERILTPDDVRGSSETLREAVEQHGWPTVDSQRGKVAFLLDNEGTLANLYLTRSSILAGCLLFTSVNREHPAAAWFKRNDPIGSYDEIVDLVRSGFLVRTRADAGTIQSRKNDSTQRDKAIASGAQLISTDYPEPDQRFSDYSVTLPLPDESSKP